MKSLVGLGTSLGEDLEGKEGRIVISIMNTYQVDTEQQQMVGQISFQIYGMVTVESNVNKLGLSCAKLRPA